MKKEVLIGAFLALVLLVGHSINAAPQLSSEIPNRLKNEWRELKEAVSCAREKGLDACTPAQKRRIMATAVVVIIAMGLLGYGGKRGVSWLKDWQKARQQEVERQRQEVERQRQEAESKRKREEKRKKALEGKKEVENEDDKKEEEPLQPMQFKQEEEPLQAPKGQQTRRRPRVSMEEEEEEEEEEEGEEIQSVPSQPPSSEPSLKLNF